MGNNPYLQVASKAISSNPYLDAANKAATGPGSNPYLDAANTAIQPKPQYQDYLHSSNSANPAYAQTAARLGIPVQHLQAIIEGESSGNTHAQTGSYYGLAQLRKEEVEKLGYDWEKYKNADVAGQLEVAEKYWKGHGYTPDMGIRGLALAQAAPAFMKRTDDPVIYKKGSAAWNSNPGWRGPDGEIRPSSITQFYAHRIKNIPNQAELTPTGLFSPPSTQQILQAQEHGEAQTIAQALQMIPEDERDLVKSKAHSASDLVALAKMTPLERTGVLWERRERGIPWLDNVVERTKEDVYSTFQPVISSVFGNDVGMSPDTKAVVGGAGAMLFPQTWLQTAEMAHDPFGSIEGMVKTLNDPAATEDQRADARFGFAMLTMAAHSGATHLFKGGAVELKGSPEGAPTHQLDAAGSLRQVVAQLEQHRENFGGHFSDPWMEDYYHSLKSSPLLETSETGVQPQQTANLYHGSPVSGLSEIRPSVSGDFGPGIYLTRDKDLATYYSQGRANVAAHHLDDAAVPRAGHVYETSTGPVNPLVVKTQGEADSIVRPLIKEGSGEPWAIRLAQEGKPETRILAEYARRNGYDGIDHFSGEVVHFKETPSTIGGNETPGVRQGTKRGAGINLFNSQAWENPRMLYDSIKNTFTDSIQTLSRHAPKAAEMFAKMAGAPADAERAINTARREMGRLSNGTFGADRSYFDKVRAFLTQDRLYGLREDAARQHAAVQAMDFKDFPGSEAEHFVNELGGGNTVSTLLESGLVDEAKQAALDAIEGAIKPGNDVLTPEEYHALQNDPRMAPALDIWDQHVGEAMKYWHELHGGEFTDRLGPSGRYIPLVREAGGQRAGIKIPFMPAKNLANRFATGTSTYTLDAGAFKDLLGNRFRRAGQNAFIQELNKSGVVRPATAADLAHGAEPKIVINGLSHEGVVKPTSPLMMIQDANGKWITPKGKASLVIPKWLDSEIGHVTSPAPDSPLVNFSRAVTTPFNWATTKGFAESIFHGGSVLHKAWGPAAGVDHPVAFVRAFFQKAGTAEWNATLKEMSRNGELPLRTAENIGASQWNPVYKAVFSDSGLDIRSRVAAHEVAKLVTDDPNLIRERVNRIGAYNMALESALVRALKKTGVNPFATSGMTGLKGAFGTGILHLYPIEAQGLAKLPIALKRQLLASGMGLVGTWYLLHKAATGKTPDEAGSAFLEIPLDNLAEKLGEIPLDKLVDDQLGIGVKAGFSWLKGKSLNMAGVNPIAARGLTTYGEKANWNVRHAGGNSRQAMLAAFTDALNSGASIVTSSPTLEFAAHATTGDSPVFAGLEDDKGKGSTVFLHTGPGRPLSTSNLGYALWNLNPTLGKIGEKFYGEGADWMVRDAQSQSNAEKWADIAIQTFLPRTVKDTKNLGKQSRFLKNQQIGEATNGRPVKGYRYR